MKLWIKVEDGHIVDAGFKTLGAGTATSGMITEMVKGKTIEEAMRSATPRWLRLWTATASEDAPLKSSGRCSP